MILSRSINGVCAPFKLLIMVFYSTLREVLLMPNRQWGGEGLLGCVFGFVMSAPFGLPFPLKFLLISVNTIDMDCCTAYHCSLPNAVCCPRSCKKKTRSLMSSRSSLSLPTQRTATPPKALQ